MINLCFKILLLIVAVSSTAASAETFCAVTVDVIAPDGKPFMIPIRIELLDPSGRVVREQFVNGPTFRICDFGFGPHTLRVGTNQCFPVAISNLKVVFGRPTLLKVIMNPCWGDSFRTGCLLYLRVADESGKPVPNASFSPPVALNEPATVDAYGRYQSMFALNHDLTFSAPGFEPAKVHVECKKTEEVDELVIMRHAQ